MEQRSTVSASDVKAYKERASTGFLLTAYPRLHFGLIDLSGYTPRAYGGAGASLCGMPIEIECRPTKSMGLTLDFGSLSEDARITVNRAIKSANEHGLNTNGDIHVRCVPPPHVGLGSTTLTVLAILQSLAVINQWAVTPEDLIRISRRGRTSGIGIGTFFTGKLVVDVGQAGHPTGNKYLPSLAPGQRPPSLAIGAWPIPERWNISLFFTQDSPSVDPTVEEKFFREATPIAPSDVALQLAHLYHGIIPAVIENDLPAFGQSIQAFQRAGFKAAEIAAQKSAVRELIDTLWEQEFAAGLSSFGPIVFVFHESTEDLEPSRRFPAELMRAGPFRVNNEGFQLEWGIELCRVEKRDGMTR
jgi:beta-ribofuranosylaminobenzene 5'-phosphate synthase